MSHPLGIPEGQDVTTFVPRPARHTLASPSDLPTFRPVSPPEQGYAAHGGRPDSRATRLPGEKLLDEVADYVARFVTLPSLAALHAVVLWIAHTHAVDNEHRLLFDMTPRLAILSSGPASGKSTLLNLVRRLSSDGISVADPTGPAIASLVAVEHRTVCIDEIDMLLGPGNGQRAVRTVLNIGFERGAEIARQGKTLDAFGPIALAGMAQNFRTNRALEPTRTRSIMITMRPAERGTDWRRGLHNGQAVSLNTALSTWVGRNGSRLATAWPTMPDSVSGRTADIWQPLIAVGEAAGPEWAQKARAACVAIAASEGDEAAEIITPSNALLVAMARVFNTANEWELTTATLLEALAILPGATYRWPSPRAGAMEISAILRPTGVRPVKLASVNLQGYRREDLKEALGNDWPSATESDEGELAPI